MLAATDHFAGFEGDGPATEVALGVEGVTCPIAEALARVDCLENNDLLLQRF